MTTTVDEATREAIRERLAILEGEVAAAQAHPSEWLRHTKAVDPKTGEEFFFHFDKGWEWQREELTSYLQNQVVLRLKARQLGVSWLGIGYCGWKCLTKPGTRALCVSINETESIKLAGRAWDLWENTPEHLRFDAKVIKPERGRPSSRIEWEFPDGRISSLIAMPSTPRAGHGETASVVFLDEFGRHPFAAESYKAFIPVIADGGQMLIVSTANGYGNLFYELWMEASDRAISAIFLGADKHPGRNATWFKQMRQRLSTADMSEQYPMNATEAFLGTAGCWFDVDAIQRYADRCRDPLYRGNFLVEEAGDKAKFTRRSDGWVWVYDQPEAEKDYAIYADIATGRGKDSTAAVVIDLTNMNIAAELQRTRPDRQVEFVIAPGLAATGDPRLLEVALQNLIGNAWKFTGKRDRARIEVGAEDRDGKPVYFVRDDGAGFDMAHASKLFQPFQRLHGAMEFEGTGIGLATVQRIIQRHGGRIWAEAAPAMGATFYFTL